MELSEEQKNTVLDILKKADGEDVEGLMDKSGWADYLLRVLVLKAPKNELENATIERDELNGKKFDREIFDIILVHVARTWERIRLMQPHQEMPLDNIESAEEMSSIADTIMDSDVIQEFIKNRDGDAWNKYGDEYSDSYIERLSHEIITNNYLKS
jgi:hypothetical protein